MEKKNRLSKTLMALGKRIYEVFKDYPVTMGAIILAALAGAILVDIDKSNVEELVERIACFSLIFAMQVIMFEELFKSKLKVRIIGYAVSVIIAGFYTFLVFFDEKTLFGADIELIDYYAVKILFVYGVFTVGLSIHHMYRRLEEDFEVYCCRAFLEVIKATIIYGLFAIGLMIVVLIFNELIFDTDEFLLRIELFLAGGIYVPMCLKALSGKNETPGKFAKICIAYVLQSMLLIAFAIIYIYIIKIFVTNDIPSNEVFDILAFLFAIGMPIWTMVHGMKEESGVWTKISYFIPYAFIPFIILQCWSIGVRISAYGYTVSRYSAIVLIVGESIYFVLYFLQHRGNRRAVSWILFVLMALSVICILIPGISYDDVVIRSQTKRIVNIIEDGKELNDHEKSQVKSAYRVIDRIGFKGEQAIEKNFTKAVRDKIEEYDEDYYSYRSTVYLRDNKKLSNVDISGYSRIYRAESLDTGSDRHTCYIQLVDADGNLDDEVLDLNVEELVDWSIANYTDENEYDFDISGREMVKIDESRDFYITKIYIVYNSVTGEVTTTQIEGYVLER